MVFVSLQPHGLQPASLLYLWNSPGKNTGVGYHSLFQGIFPTHGSNTGVLHFRQILYHLSHQGSLNLPERPYSFKRGHHHPACPWQAYKSTPIASYPLLTWTSHVSYFESLTNMDGLLSLPEKQCGGDGWSWLCVTCTSLGTTVTASIRQLP